MSASVIEAETVKVLTMQEDGDKLNQLARLYREFMSNYMQRVSQDVSGETAVSN